MQKTSVKQLANKIQTLLSSVADQAAQDANFIKRARVLTPMAFVQGLTLAWMQNPDSTLENLAHYVAMAGAPMVPQSLDERFTPSAADFLQKVLLHASSQVIRSSPADVELFKRFHAIYVHDGCVITLPPELVEIWKGCGGPYASISAVKMQVRLELCSGQLTGPVLCDASENDLSSDLPKGPFPEGSLNLNDMGFFP